MAHLSDYEQQFNREIERQICRMEQPGYPFPKRFGRQAALIWAIVVIICLASIIAGAWL